MFELWNVCGREVSTAHLNPIGLFPSRKLALQKASELPAGLYEVWTIEGELAARLNLIEGGRLAPAVPPLNQELPWDECLEEIQETERDLVPA